jgi:acetolactate synthase-1/2/3 large subunit
MTQEARQTEILRPAVKELVRIEDGARIPELVRRAFEIATSGRPGPVILEVPEDVCHGRHGYSVDALGSDPAVHAFPSRRARPDASDVARAAALIAGAKRPIVLAGGGVHLSGAQHQLTRFAEALGIPVAHTLSGKGAIPCTHPLSAGLFGRYSRIGNELIAASDCILVVGCKLGEIATKRYALPPEDIPLIHLEVVAEEIGRVRSPEVALWGDARAGLEDIGAELADSTDRQREARTAYTHEVAERMERWRAAVAPRLATDERPIAMPRLVNELNRMLPAEAVLVADGGFAAHWTGLLYDSKRSGRCYVANRGFASIGYGLPGAIGAKLAEPTHPVVAVTGDGGFNMSLGELETARRAKAPVVVIVVNNAASGYVKALQQAVFDGHFQSSDLSEMDYAAIAEAMGCHGHRVEDPGQLAGALTKALGQDDAPSVIDVVVTRDPAAMLPGVDSRTAEVREGDRIA